MCYPILDYLRYLLLLRYHTLCHTTPSHYPLLHAFIPRTPIYYIYIVVLSPGYLLFRYGLPVFTLLPLHYDRYTTLPTFGSYTLLIYIRVPLHYRFVVFVIVVHLLHTYIDCDRCIDPGPGPTGPRLPDSPRLDPTDC